MVPPVGLGAEREACLGFSLCVPSHSRELTLFLKKFKNILLFFLKFRAAKIKQKPGKSKRDTAVSILVYVLSQSLLKGLPKAIFGCVSMTAKSVFGKSGFGLAFIHVLDSMQGLRSPEK